MISTVHLPLPYGAYVEGSFALFTLRERFPRIVADILRALPSTAVADPRWRPLLDSVLSGAVIDGHMLAPSTGFWAARRDELSGRLWSELGFMELEFVFYHALNTIFSGVSRDVFATARSAALDEALPRIAALLDSGPALDLAHALDLSLLGNRVDLSQLARGGVSRDSRMVVDERAALLARARSAKDVHVVADNAGEELCCDLLLCATLLERDVGSVTLHLKPWPMFVSDAMPGDVTGTPLAFRGRGGSERTRRAAARLDEASNARRFLVAAANDWGEPRSFDQLRPGLTSVLAAADLVILKGDLNYRRCLGDRSWPTATPIGEAASVPFGPTFAMRVLKSETVSGVTREDVARLDRETPTWRTDGRHAMVQRVDGGGADEGDGDRELQTAGGAASNRT